MWKNSFLILFLLARHIILIFSPLPLTHLSHNYNRITSRLSKLFVNSSVLGIDVIDSHLELAKARHGVQNDKLSFVKDDIFKLSHADNTFDLTVCRHVTQALQQPETAIAELLRVTKRDGVVHLLVEDYGMLFTSPRDTSEFWRRGPLAYGDRIGASLRAGRECFALLKLCGVDDSQITIDYLSIDT
jgi:SAM-dependent methyltransferase